MEYYDAGTDKTVQRDIIKSKIQFQSMFKVLNSKIQPNKFLCQFRPFDGWQRNMEQQQRPPQGQNQYSVMNKGPRSPLLNPQAEPWRFGSQPQNMPQNQQMNNNQVLDGIFYLMVVCKFYFLFLTRVSCKQVCSWKCIIKGGWRVFRSLDLCSKGHGLKTTLKPITKCKERISQLSVIPGKKAKGITWCGHIQRKDQCCTTRLN